MKYFNELTKTQQQKIRKEYKQTHPKNYNHSIHLFILYVCLGLMSVLSILIMTFKNKLIGILLFILFFIMILINLYLLSKSNLPFYKFLLDKGYKIKKK